MNGTLTGRGGQHRRPVRRVGRGLAAAAVSATLAATGACAEHNVVPPERGFLAQFSIAGFERLRVISAAGANGYFFGPTSFDPSRDVTSPVPLAVPPATDHSDAVYQTIADGKGRAADGSDCYVSIGRSQKDGPQHRFWELTPEQSRLVDEGSHIVVDIDVECEQAGTQQ